MAELDEDLVVRSRIQEFNAYRMACKHRTRKFVDDNPNAQQDENATQIPEVGGWLPSWARVLDEFPNLETKVSKKVDVLLEYQYNYFRNVFISEEKELELLEAVEKQAADVQKLLQELERMVMVGVVPKDPTNIDEIRVVGNAKKYLSSRLRLWVQKFKNAQDVFAARLKRRKEKQKSFMKVGTDETRKFLEKEDKAAHYMGLGYTEQDIEQLLEEDTRQEEVNKEIREIVESVNELHSLFTDLNTLVVEQGTMLDRIDYSLAQSACSVSRGLEQLKKAQEYQSTCAVM